jgi:hypothetical protein
MEQRMARKKKEVRTDNAVAQPVENSGQTAAAFASEKLELIGSAPDSENLRETGIIPESSVTHHNQLDKATEFNPAELEKPKPFITNPSSVRREPLAERDWTKYADPNPRQSVKWADGYEIAVQESKSRQTVEIQFGDGSTRDKPQNFPAIKEVVTKAGMHFNGTNAWVIELETPPSKYRESQAEKLGRIERNAALRARIEDEVFPAVLALEEQKRGQIDLTEQTRQRIAKAAEMAR